MKKISRQIVDCFQKGGKLLIFGCGGLAAESSHFAGEMMGKFAFDRKPLPAISLCCDPVVMTAIANDYGFEYVFARQILALAQPRDLIIGMSTSGKSKSINNGLKMAERLKINFLDWPRTKGTVAQIQEKQIRLMHQVCREVEKELFW